MLSHLSHVRLFVSLWTVGHQAPLSLGFSRQEYWSGLPCCPTGEIATDPYREDLYRSVQIPTGDLPTQGLNLCLLGLLQVGSLSLALPGKPKLVVLSGFFPNKWAS